uniref:5-demethoxyubiquinone hydroxylase, mitochondrial isoform X3 n=1 Tax=Nyctereutes procyonoides TaxID=34880 RepID=UPI002444E9A2|nr:5-demethoxyubiquinone hydroxylase, mitochondrial isoform X3 [Nyctereutes procyonoides]
MSCAAWAAVRSLWRLRAGTLRPLTENVGSRKGPLEKVQRVDGCIQGAADDSDALLERGAGTALLGKEGAMACTVAVEESIAHHYNNQIRTLMEKDPEKYEELLQVIRKFRDEELEHHDIGLEHDAQLAPGYTILKNLIQAGCSMAIYLSERF